MNKKVSAWIVLTLIAVVAAVALAATNEVTRDVIKQANMQATQTAWETLVPGASFPDAQADLQAQADGAAAPESYVYTGVVDGEPVGYVGAVTENGYGGPIEIIVGSDTDGVITGINVGGANFQETAGLGMKAKDAAFTDQFAGKTAPITLGEDVDAITAATITSNAVVRGVNAAMTNISEIADFSIDVPQALAEEVGENRYAATTEGFAGPVYVEIQLDGNNTITEIVIGNDSFNETAGFGQKAQEPAFYEQFIGKTGQLTLGEDIDAIAGATITSKAVIDAVNQAMLFATDPEAAALAQSSADPAAGETEQSSGSAGEPTADPAANTATAEAQGFLGPVAAAITVDDNGVLEDVVFGNDAFVETESLGGRILEDEFAQQFIGKQLPLADGDVDVISGATITSNAAVQAVNDAYAALLDAKGEEPAGTAAPDEDEADVNTETAATADPAANTATAEVQGFLGPVAAAITVDDNGVLEDVVFGNDAFVETESLGGRILEDEFAQQFIGKQLPLADGDVDAISGATITSDAAVQAVNNAYAALLDAKGEEPAGTTTPDEDEANVNTETAATADLAANTATAIAQGYIGPVAATITVSSQNTIKAIAFGNEDFAETETLGGRILEPDFIKQFIGKQLPLADGDVDAISGATITSDAAVQAVNDAYAALLEAKGEEPAGTTSDEDEANVNTETAASADLAANTATAIAQGYIGPVAATITVSSQNTIKAIAFGNEDFAETETLGGRILEPDFIKQFIGKSLPLKEGDIDAISGATVTSNAAVEAVNNAFDTLRTQ